MASQQLSQPEASNVEKKFNQGRVIASGSAFINPQVDNNVTISLKLKKELAEYPFSDFKLYIMSPMKFYEQDMNCFVKAMPVNKPEKFVEVLFWDRIPEMVVGNELKFVLVDQAPLPGNFLVCLGSSVKVDPVNSN